MNGKFRKYFQTFILVTSIVGNEIHSEQVEKFPSLKSHWLEATDSYGFQLQGGSFTDQQQNFTFSSYLTGLVVKREDRSTLKLPEARPSSSPASPERRLCLRDLRDFRLRLSFPRRRSDPSAAAAASSSASKTSSEFHTQFYLYH